jgi:hypothetical protein
VGELRQVWFLGFSRNILCTCGTEFRSCPFWQAVAQEAFGGMDGVDALAIRMRRRAVQRIRHIPKVAMPSLRSSRFQQSLDVYRKSLAPLYEAIRKVSGCDIIVDSSKSPEYGVVLGSMLCDLRVIHLVRDSRAVAHSWERVRLRPEIREGNAYMPRYGSARAALRWDLHNLLARFLGSVSSRYVFLRYEDLVDDVEASLAGIISGLGLDGVEVPVREGGLHRGHMISGNPMVYSQTPLAVKIDREWEYRMTRSKKFIVTSLTWPFLLKYGY